MHEQIAAPWREADAVVEAQVLAHLDDLAHELSVERPAARAEPIPDFKRLAAELVEARTNAVRLVVMELIEGSRWPASMLPT